MNTTGHQNCTIEFSVIVPTLNGAKQLRELLSSFRIQTVQPAEVIVVDSSSSDNTVQVAEEFGAKVISIKKENFDHGGTRTMAARIAKHGYLVFFTQDIVPAHRKVLEQLIAPLSSSNNIAATYGRQLPAFDATESARHLRLFNYPEKSLVKSYEDRDRLGLQTVFISNSCAAYNKRLLAEVGYFRDDLIFGEDTCAIGRLLEKGHKVSYVAEGAVYHSHNYDWVEEFKRYFDIGVLHTTENWLLETYGGAESRGFNFITSGLSYYHARRKHSLIGDFMVRVVLKYLGYQLGRKYLLLPGRLVPDLSMHRNWWNKI